MEITKKMNSANAQDGNIIWLLLIIFAKVSNLFQMNVYTHIKPTAKNILETWNWPYKQNLADPFCKGEQNANMQFQN